MSVRATYEFKDPRRADKSLTLYGHYDGYPDGAAEKMALMIKALYSDNPNHIFFLAEKSGGFSHAFIRGNEDVTITEDKDAHVDTEWHYTVFQNDENKPWVDCFEVNSVQGSDEREYTKTISIPLQLFINMGKWSKDTIHDISIEDSKKQWLLHEDDIIPKLKDAYQNLARYNKDNPNYRVSHDWVLKLEELSQKILDEKPQENENQPRL